MHRRSCSISKHLKSRDVRAEIDLSTGTISGNLHLNGTVAFSADGSGTQPPTAPATAGVFRGPLVLTTARGTLTPARDHAARARAKKQIRYQDLQDLSARLRAAIDGVRGSTGLERIVVKDAGRITFLNVDEIDWIEAADNYVQLHAGGASHLVHGTLTKLEARLAPAQFLRVHRSPIVNVSRIQALEPLSHGEYRIVLRDGTDLVSGRTYRERLDRLVTSSL